MNKENTGIQYTRSHKRHDACCKTRPRYRPRTSKSFYHLRLELLPPPLSQTEWNSLKPAANLAPRAENGWRTIRNMFTPTDLFSKLHEIYPVQGFSIVSTFPIVSQYPEEVAPGWKE